MKITTTLTVPLVGGLKLLISSSSYPLSLSDRAATTLIQPAATNLYTQTTVKIFVPGPGLTPTHQSFSSRLSPQPPHTTPLLQPSTPPLDSVSQGLMKIFRTVEALGWFCLCCAPVIRSYHSFPCLHFHSTRHHLPPQCRRNAHEKRRKVAWKRAADEKLRRQTPRSWKS